MISEQQVRCFLVLKQAKSWITNAELAERAKVSGRCARFCSKFFVDQEIIERVYVYPKGYLLKFHKDASIGNSNLLCKLERLAGVLGLA